MDVAWLLSGDNFGWTKMGDECRVTGVHDECQVIQKWVMGRVKNVGGECW
jgi:hypothetical protein